MRQLSLWFGVVLLVGLSGCAILPTEEDTLSLTGQIEKIEVDCGGWGLQTDDEFYELVKLPEEYRVDGVRARMEVKLRKDLGSCAMVGPIVEVLQVEEVD